MAVIVTADDDTDIRHIVSRVLRQAGHTVIEAADGASAVAETRTRRPDLVVLDGEMPPGMSGFEACEVLHDDPDTAMIPLMMVTGSMPPNDVREQHPYLRGVLGKPFTPQQLTACVRQAMAGPGSGG